MSQGHAQVRRLDTPGGRFYKRALLGAWLAGWAWAGVAAADVVSGAQLPDSAEKVGENRYRVREDYETVVKYYRTVYSTSAFPRRTIVNQPGVKAFHITNLSGKNFEGLNIYQANDEVRIYIIPVAEAKPAKKKPDAKKKEAKQPQSQ